ncbi:MAG: NADH-quinone oxidoreductase subunit C [Deltaproteobacteria bacterium]|nr:NADH-quinone oxidoreductase subunit C [Deltaproteobacteria bacterium]
MKFEEIELRLRTRFGAAIREAKPDALDPWIAVDPAALPAVALFLRDAEELAFDDLSILTATDFPPDRIQVAYHLWSYRHHHLLVLKVDLPRAEPGVQTVGDLWPAASWYEREMYDLLGVRFAGHPALRRLLLPEDWEGHPLRKDWREPEQYQGMPTSRTFSIDLFGDYANEIARSRPLRGLLVHDGEETRRSGEVLAARLGLADIDVELAAVHQIDPRQASGRDLLLIGVHGKGLLAAATDGNVLSFVERLPDLGGLPCAVYEVYTATAGDVLDQVCALLARKNGRLLGRGAVIAGRPDKDPDGLAATLLDALRSGALARPPAPPAPAPSAPTAASETRDA